MIKIYELNIERSPVLHTKFGRAKIGNEGYQKSQKNTSTFIGGG